MADKEKGWELPKDMEKFMSDYNRKAFLTNFPPEAHWPEITGMMYQEVKDGRAPLVSIQGCVQEVGDRSLWIDLPNAMYLLGLLMNLQRQTGAKPLFEPPAPSAPHPES